MLAVVCANVRPVVVAHDGSFSARKEIVHDTSACPLRDCLDEHIDG
jgi:hypothetical protein